MVELHQTGDVIKGGNVQQEDQNRQGHDEVNCVLHGANLCVALPLLDDLRKVEEKAGVALELEHTGGRVASPNVLIVIQVKGWGGWFLTDRRANRRGGVVGGLGEMVLGHDGRFRGLDWSE